MVWRRVGTDRSTVMEEGGDRQKYSDEGATVTSLTACLVGQAVLGDRVISRREQVDGPLVSQ